MRFLFEQRFSWLEVLSAMIAAQFLNAAIDVYFRPHSVSNHRQVEIDKSHGADLSKDEKR